MMFAHLLAAAIATSGASPCPVDLAVANPRLKVTRGIERGYDHDIVTVDVTNRGTNAQRSALRQHLELLLDGRLAGSQPIPALAAGERYVAAFRLRFPAQRKRTPLAVRFRYVLDDSRDPQHDDCVTANDVLDAKL